MSSVTVRPATPADSDAIANIHYQALSSYHEFYAAFFERHPRDLIPLATRNGLQNPAQHFSVAEEAGGVVGFIRYKEPNSNASVGQNNVNANDKPQPSVWTIKEHMKDFWKWFDNRSEEMDESKEKVLEGKDHFDVMHIMVHPDHQRKGIGGLLLKTVLDKADAANLPTTITSSSEGYGLYKKLGFESLGTWSIDNEAWAHKIAEHERNIGYTDGVIGLEDKCKGMQESEDSMIRQPKIRT
ncbi:acyl-CoA N-acyltransferase [Fusarium flagelliforme]|uniref:Gnat family acetyltransferase n=1 Tax=Fusarium flagelliforme TaxID=2675880 RepID=A0A395N3Z3_9HYPO|nr:acyl-CoA N-acyltransferase [Fusarium flagelliforme]KAH7182526.1 acyl-CoA N-acyltransferase [Fusarium flagelliforme]RFN54715.1 gnat family acetyltransferase [Fusarium flagelliforme]